MIGVAAAAGAGAFAQGAGFGLAVAYANGLEAGQTFDLRLISVTPREDLWALYAVGAAVTVSFLLAVGLLYFFQRGAVRLGKDYEAFCVRRTLSLASHLPHPDAKTANQLLEGKYLERLLNDARLCGRVLRLLTSSLLPLIITPASLAVMLILNPFLSLFISCLALIGAGSLYRVNVKGARATNKMEELSREASQQRRQAVTRVLQTSAPLSDDDRELKRLTTEGATRGRLDAYADRLEAVEESGLVTGALSAGALGTILVVEGQGIVGGEGSVSLLVAYLGVLRLFVTNFMKFGRAVSSVSRFYPQTRRHFEFTEAASAAERGVGKCGAPPVTVYAEYFESPLNRCDTTCQFDAGTGVVLVAPGKIDRSVLSRLANPRVTVNSSGESVTMRLVGSEGPASNTKVGSFGLPSWVDEASSSYDSIISSSRLLEQTLEEAGGLQGSHGTVTNEVGKQDRVVLSFLAAVLSEPDIIVVQHEEWSEVGAELRMELERLASNVVLAYGVTPADDDVEFEPDAAAIVVGEDGLIGYASYEWVRQNWGFVKKAMKSSSNTTQRVGQSAMVEEEEEIE